METTLFKKLKDHMNINDYSGDKWATAMGLFFDVAGMIYDENECPIEWQYRPGTMGNHIDTESSNYDFLIELTPNERMQIGVFVNRLTIKLQNAGLSY